MTRHFIGFIDSRKQRELDPPRERVIAQEELFDVVGRTAAFHDVDLF
jgi:hypothetical protein